jgi:hypothetical protein
VSGIDTEALRLDHDRHADCRCDMADEVPDLLDEIDALRAVRDAAAAIDTDGHNPFGRHSPDDTEKVCGGHSDEDYPVFWPCEYVALRAAIEKARPK